MPYTVAPASVIELRYRFAQASQEMMVIRHYRYSGPSTIPDGASAAQLLGEHTLNPASTAGGARFGARYKALSCMAGVALYAVDAQWIYPTRYNPIRTTMTVAGDDTANPVPTGVAAFIEFKAELAGKKNRGGMHIPGLSSSAVGIDSKWTPAYVGRLQLMADTMIESVIATGPLIYGPWAPMIFRRKDAANSQVIFQAVVHTTIRTERSRVVGLGI